MNSKSRLGELWVRSGVLSPQQLDRAKSEHQRYGGSLGRIVVERLQVPESMLVSAVVQQMGLIYVPLAEADPPRVLIDKLGDDFLRAHDVLPVAHDLKGRNMTLAMADPTQVGVVDEVQFRTGLRVIASVAGAFEMEAALERALGPAFGLGWSYGAGPGGRQEELVLEEPAVSGASAHVSTGEFPAQAPRTGEFPVQRPRTGEFPVQRPRTGEFPPQAPRTGEFPVQAPRTGEFPVQRPRTGEIVERSHRTGEIPAQTTRTGELPPSDRLAKVASTQRQQARALRVLVDMLVERGVFTRDEWLGHISAEE